MGMLVLVEVLLLNFSLIRVIPMLPAEAWGHLIQLGHQGSVATSRFVWLPPGLFTLADGMGLFLGIDSRKAEMHSSNLQAEDRTVSVSLLKFPGLLGL